MRDGGRRERQNRLEEVEKKKKNEERKSLFFDRSFSEFIPSFELDKRGYFLCFFSLSIYFIQFSARRDNSVCYLCLSQLQLKDDHRPFAL